MGLPKRTAQCRDLFRSLMKSNSACVMRLFSLADCLRFISMYHLAQKTPASIGGGICLSFSQKNTIWVPFYRGEVPSCPCRAWEPSCHRGRSGRRAEVYSCPCRVWGPSCHRGQNCHRAEVPSSPYRASGPFRLRHQNGCHAGAVPRVRRQEAQACSVSWPGRLQERRTHPRAPWQEKRAVQRH